MKHSMWKEAVSGILALLIMAASAYALLVMVADYQDELQARRPAQVQNVRIVP